MVQHAIYENEAKKIIKQNIDDNNFVILPNLIVDDLSKFKEKSQHDSWINENKLVIKPDQCIKGRGLSGIVGLNYDFNDVIKYLDDHFDKEYKIGIAAGKLNRFIIEPFVDHQKENEHYLCIYNDKDCDTISYSCRGGIDIGDIRTHAIELNIPICAENVEKEIHNRFDGVIDKNVSCILIDLMIKLYNMFCSLNFTYLEFNPLIIKDKTITVVDVAAKVDTCAEFICGKKWELSCYPVTFGRELSKEEKYISELDSKSGASLKFTIINKNGRIWTLVAGGGASVVFCDTICDLGFSSELGNYGEYSGAPTSDETYEYASTVINCLLNAPKYENGKILIIAGGIANFTNVATTFKGIIKAIKEKAPLLIEHNVRIFVRRGGPNYEEGLRNIKDACDKLNIVSYVFGIDAHMTSMVAMALDLKPIKDTFDLNLPENVSFPSRQITNNFKCNNISDNCINNNLKNDALFTDHTTAIVWGFQEVAIQGMLDFDYLCRREKPSVCCMIYPFRSSLVCKFYFGLKEIFIPIFKTFSEACSKFDQASVLINFASMRSSYEVSMEALNFDQFRIISIFAEGIPERQTRLINYYAKDKNVTIIGPSSIGGIKPGSFRIGHAGGMINNIVTCKLYRPGSVAYITRSGGMSNELNNILSRVTDGVYEGIHIGGDRYPGSSYTDHIFRFNNDPNVELIVILGEVGGLEEYSICDALKANVFNKPIVAWCIGTCSYYFHTDIQFGHANACADGMLETANHKNKCLKAAGAYVPDCFDQLSELISSVYNSRVKEGKWKCKKDIVPPPIPVDYKYAKEMGLIRKPTSFISTICDDRGNEPCYSGVPISTILNDDLGIGGTIGLLWFQRKLPSFMCRFFEICLVILADHGPAVSGAHNTIVTARAGKDMLSSLCSGLLTIGDRFGGAINGAAVQFWSAFRGKKTPSQFVQDTRNSGKLILGIGHLVKSVTNPDERVKKLISFVKDSNINTPLLDYAMEVEKITTTKKSNLILNVDGAIGVLMIDMMLATNQFTIHDIEVYLNIEAFNAIFILSRSIGFIGHFIDQKRLKQGLYRHPWDDISFIDRFDLNN